MLQILLPKELFEDIVLTKQKIIEKKVNNYWKKELLDISIVDDKIHYKIKTIQKLRVANEYGEDKPNIVVECLKLDYNVKKNMFEFYLGKIIEKRNVETQSDYKDILIQQLLKEKKALQESINKDELTQMYNRKKFNEDLNTFVAQNNAKYLSAIFITLNEFKTFNQNIEQELEEKIIKYIANKIRIHAKRLYAEVYRYKDEEFVMLCFLPQDQLTQGLHYLKEDISTVNLQGVTEINVKVNMGVSFFKNYLNAEEFFKQAVLNEKEAKKLGTSSIFVE
ncbi:MAG: GGDEF domain-containing protein [Arcobacteraceae bacterium]